MNLAELIQRAVEAVVGRMIWRGTVTGTSGNRVTVQREGETTAASYPRLASYTPTNGDEVLVLAGVVVGRIVR